MTLRKLTADEVIFEFTVEPEDIPVRGNFIVSGDDAADKAAEDEIIDLLDRGFTEAWCYIKVTARWNGFTAFAGLGACSYAPDTSTQAIEDDARQHGLFDEALDNLNEELKRIDARLPRAEEKD